MNDRICPTEDQALRFWSNVQKTDECWYWTGELFWDDYGRFHAGGKAHRAHRWSYEVHTGKIPEGLVIDHVKDRGCISRRCVNPAHLEAVTNRENLLRGDTIVARAASATECPTGHPYSDENTTRRGDGSRACRACQRAREQARRSQGGDKSECPFCKKNRAQMRRHIASMHPEEIRHAHVHG